MMHAKKVKESSLEPGNMLRGKEIEGWDVIGDDNDCPGSDRLSTGERYDIAHVSFVDGTSACVVLVRNG